MSKLDDYRKASECARKLVQILSVAPSCATALVVSYEHAFNYHLHLHDPRDPEGKGYRIDEDWDELQHLLTPLGIKLSLRGNLTIWRETFLREIRSATYSLRVEARDEAAAFLGEFPCPLHEELSKVIDSLERLQ